MPDRCRLCGTAPTTSRAPGLCAGCARDCVPPTAPVCVACGEAWSRAAGCARCRRFERAFAFDGVAALWRYRGAARDLVRAVKYGADAGLWHRLGRVLGACPRVAGIVGGRDLCVVPVPPTPGGRRAPHAERLARGASERLGLDVEPRLLHVAARRLERQSRASARERRRARRDAYRARTAPEHVLLVDDVMSTGATLDGCARALRRAGARSVHAAVMAT